VLSHRMTHAVAAGVCSVLGDLDVLSTQATLMTLSISPVQ